MDSTLDIARDVSEREDSSGERKNLPCTFKLGSQGGDVARAAYAKREIQVS